MSSSGAERKTSAAKVRVQVCGRVEVASLEEVSVHALATAVEQLFEVRPPFLYVDREGTPLADDEALAACVANGGVVIVKLTEGVLYDFSRRVDQLRHLQWGYISDQLSLAKKVRAPQEVGCSKWRSELEHEQGLRHRGLQELRLEVDKLGRTLRDDRAALDIALHRFAEQLAECQRALIGLRRREENRHLDAAISDVRSDDEVDTAGSKEKHDNASGPSQRLSAFCRNLEHDIEHESKERERSIAKVQQLACDLRTRVDAHAKTTDDAVAALQVQQKECAQIILHQRTCESGPGVTLPELEDRVEVERQARHADVKRLIEGIAEIRHEVSLEHKSVESAKAELQSVVSELRGRMQDGAVWVPSSIAEVLGAACQQACQEACQQLRGECMEELRFELRRTVQQLETLQEDFLKALARETQLRTERDADLQASFEQALENQESHVHELRIEGLDPTLAAAVLSNGLFTTAPRPQPQLIAPGSSVRGKIPSLSPLGIRVGVSDE